VLLSLGIDGGPSPRREGSDDRGREDGRYARLLKFGPGVDDADRDFPAGARRGTGAGRQVDLRLAAVPWAPGIDGTLKYDIPPKGDGGVRCGFLRAMSRKPQPRADVDAEARKGNWSALTDVVYLDVESGDAKVKSGQFHGTRRLVSRFPPFANLDTKATLRGVPVGFGRAALHRGARRKFVAGPPRGVPLPGDRGEDRLATFDHG